MVPQETTGAYVSTIQLQQSVGFRWHQIMLFHLSGDPAGSLWTLKAKVLWNPSTNAL